MRTCFAHRRVIGSGHTLDGGLGGYCWSNLPWVPWAAGYGPKLLDTIGSLQWHTTGEETTHPVTRKPPTSTGPRGVPTNQKRIN
jgi:hypothetical protein